MLLANYFKVVWSQVFCRFHCSRTSPPHLGISLRHMFINFLTLNVELATANTRGLLNFITAVKFHTLQTNDVMLFTLQCNTFMLL